MGLEMKYFVLNPKSKHSTDKYARASRHAMKAYSNVICVEDPELAKALFDWQKKERDAEDVMTINAFAIANKPTQQTRGKPGR